MERAWGGSNRYTSDMNRILTPREAVAYLGVSLSTLNRIEKQVLLVPFRTPGVHRRYHRKMLDEYLEATRRNHWLSVGMDRSNV